MLAASTQALLKALDPLLPVYVLIDPMLGEPIPLFDSAPPTTHEACTQARVQAWQHRIYGVPLHHRTQLPVHQQPYLVCISISDATLARTIELACEAMLAAQEDGLLGEGRAAHAIGGWLQSSQPGELVAAQVADMCRLRTEVPSSASYLRQSDPRVVDWLRFVSGDAALSAQLGCISTWHYLSPFGRIETLPRIEGEASPLILNPDKFQQLMQCESVQCTLARLRGALQTDADPQPLARSDRQQMYTALLQALADADIAAGAMPTRFTHDRDRHAWALLHVRYPGMVERPAVRQLLATQDEDLPQSLHDLLPYLIDALTSKQ